MATVTEHLQSGQRSRAHQASGPMAHIRADVTMAQSPDDTLVRFEVNGKERFTVSLSRREVHELLSVINGHLSHLSLNGVLRGQFRDALRKEGLVE